MRRRSMFRLAAAILCVAALGAPAAVAEGKPTAGAEAAFAQLFQTMRQNDWAGCAKLMHPEALDQMHRVFLSLAEQDDSGQVATVFLGVANREEAAKVTPAGTFAGVMRSVVTMNPGMDEVFGGSTADVLGSVVEGDVVHVVYRMHMSVEGNKVSKIAVAPFKAQGGKWLGLLTGDMEGMIQSLEAQLGG